LVVYFWSRCPALIVMRVEFWANTFTSGANLEAESPVIWAGFPASRRPPA